MFTSFYKKPFFNKELSNYCFQSTMKSVQNMIERQKAIIWDDSKERLKYSNSLILFKNPNPNPNNNPYIILVFIPFIYFFYQQGRKLLTH